MLNAIVLTSHRIVRPAQRQPNRVAIGLRSAVLASLAAFIGSGCAAHSSHHSLQLAKPNTAGSVRAFSQQHTSNNPAAGTPTSNTMSGPQCSTPNVFSNPAGVAVVPHSVPPVPPSQSTLQTQPLMPPQALEPGSTEPSPEQRACEARVARLEQSLNQLQDEVHTERQSREQLSRTLAAMTRAQYQKDQELKELQDMIRRRDELASRNHQAEIRSLDSISELIDRIPVPTHAAAHSSASEPTPDAVPTASESPGSAAPLPTLDRLPSDAETTHD